MTWICGQRHRYANCDLAELEECLKKTQDKRVRMIATDGVFSMEGDVCNLPKIAELAQKYNARVMTDDAHALGVLGEHGRGTAEYFGRKNGLVQTKTSPARPCSR